MNQKGQALTNGDPTSFRGRNGRMAESRIGIELKISVFKSIIEISVTFESANSSIFIEKPDVPKNSQRLRRE